jgi:hypothetical protein
MHHWGAEGRENAIGALCVPGPAASVGEAADCCR